MCKLTSFSEPLIVRPIHCYFFPEGIKRVKSETLEINFDKPNKRAIIERNVMQLSAIGGALVVAVPGLLCHILKAMDPSMTRIVCLILCALIGYIIGALVAAKSLPHCCVVKEPSEI